MSRENNEDNISASLDLLLDTMCDMFGTVMFISMLVVIMTNMTSRSTSLVPPTETSRASLAQTQEELNVQLARLQTLRAAAEQQAAIEKQVINPETRRLLEQVKQKQAARASLAEERGKLLDDAGKSQTDVNRIAGDIQKLDAELASARAALSAAEKRLRDEVAVRSQAARLPKLRETTRTEIAFFLKGGRLTSYVKKNTDGTLAPNSVEVLDSTSGGRQFIEPKPGSGIAINPAEESNAPLARVIADFDKSKHYLAIFVWPDSFEHFAPIRDALVRAQFEYRLVVLPDGEKVPVTSSAVRPLVQ